MTACGFGAALSVGGSWVASRRSRWALASRLPRPGGGAAERIRGRTRSGGRLVPSIAAVAGPPAGRAETAKSPLGPRLQGPSLRSGFREATRGDTIRQQCRRMGGFGVDFRCALFAQEVPSTTFVEPVGVVDSQGGPVVVRGGGHPAGFVERRMHHV